MGIRPLIAEQARQKQRIMVKARRWVLKHHFAGPPKKEDFDLVEEELPEVKDGEFMYRSLFISVDPYQRPYTDRIPASAFPEGSEVLIYGGWTERGICNPDAKAVSNISKP